MEILIVIAAVFIAWSKNRSGFFWGFMTLIFSGWWIVLLLLLPKISVEELEEEERAMEKFLDGDESALDVYLEDYAQ